MLLLTVAQAVARLHQQLHLFSAKLADPLRPLLHHLRAAPLQGCAWERGGPEVRVEAPELLCRPSVVSELLRQQAPAEVLLPLDRRARAALV